MHNCEPPRADWQIETPQKKLGLWLTHTLRLRHTIHTLIQQFPFVLPQLLSCPLLFPFSSTPLFSPLNKNLKTATRMRVVHIPRTLFHFVSSLVCSTTNQRAWLFVSLLSLFFCLKLLSLFSFLTEIESFFTLFILSFLDHVFLSLSLSLSLFCHGFVVLLAVGLSLGFITWNLIEIIMMGFCYFKI